MMSCSPVSAGMSPGYYAHDGYYTHALSEHDRWDGKLAEAMGLNGQVTQKQFTAIHEGLIDEGRTKRVGMDCSFSAPKSVSLAMAESAETREIIQKLHGEAVRKAVAYIEDNYIKTRVSENGHKHTVKTGNCAVATFEHYTNRNNDLDLHTHAVIENMTLYKGKLYSIEYGDMLRDQKEIGLVYRQFLAKELKKEGFELELTDKKHGFFELKGFDRETIMEHSTRRQEIIEAMKQTGGKNARDAQQATMKTRQQKTSADLEKNMGDIKKELFDSGKVKIERNGKYDERRNESNSNERGRGKDIGSYAIESGFGNLGGIEGRQFKSLEERHSLPNLSDRGLDASAKTTNMLLPGGTISRLAIVQSERERNAFMQRTDGRERVKNIDEISAETIKEISREKFAFTIPEIRQRIMSAGVIDGITRQEAEKAMERAGLVKLGHIEREGKQSKDVYLTTEQNIKLEAAIIDRVQEGKGTIKSLSQDESQAAFNKLKEAKELRGEKFTPNEEQTNAIHHVMTCNDRYLVIQGLAGTGKTYTMTSIRELCEQEGITIRGACFTGKAADGLQNESGINSGTIHSFLNRLEAGKFNEPTRMDVLKKAATEIAIETLNNGKLPPKDVPQPERTRSETLARAAKEVIAEQLPNPDDRKAAMAALRREDSDLYYQQQHDKRAAENGGIKQEWGWDNVQKAKGREIWIVDEAGLVGTNLMDQLQQAAEARGAQIVFSGDYLQMPAVDAGEPMKNIIEDGKAATAFLEDIRRQSDTELLEAVKESVQGNHIKTFEILEKRGAYHEIADTKERHEAIKNEITKTKLDGYIKEKPDGDRKLANLLLVSTNADRKNYNKEIRAEYVRRGELEEGKEYKITGHDGDKKITEKRHFAVGDRMIFTENDRKMDVKNGTLGMIEKIEDNKFTVRTDAGESKEFYIDKYSSIDHSYAVTNYKAQGMTVMEVYADMNTKAKAQDRNSLYVDISRAKEKAHIYTDDKAKLEKQTQDFAKKITSKDFSERIASMERGNRIENNDRYHAPEKESVEKVIGKAMQEPPEVTKYKQAELAKQLAAEQAKQHTVEKVKIVQKTIKTPSNERGMSR